MRRLGDGDHRASWARSTCGPAGPIVYTSARLGVPDRHPRGRGAAGDSCTSGAGSPAASWTATTGGPGDRPAVRRASPGRSSARPTGATSRCRRPGRRCSTAASRRGRRRLRRRQDRGHLRRARPDRVPLLALERRRRRPHARVPPAARAVARVREPRGLRLEVRPPQRPRRVRAVRRGPRRAPPGAPSDAVGDGLLFLTGDHGCDPTTPSTDHSREYTPMLVAGARRRPGRPRGAGLASPTSARPSPRSLGVPDEGLAGQELRRRAGTVTGGPATGEGWDPRDVVAAKRDGRPVDQDELRSFVLGYARGEIADYQAAAFLMAAFINGLSTAETAAMTRAMVDSGITLPLSGVSRPKVDKHSTGGVSDGVTLVFAPLAAVARAGGGQALRPRARAHGRDARQARVDPGLRTALSTRTSSSAQVERHRVRRGRPDRRPGPRRRRAVRAAGRHGDGAEHPAHRGQRDVEEARGRDRPDPARREGRERGVHEDARRRRSTLADGLRGPGRGAGAAEPGRRSPTCRSRSGTAIGNALDVAEAVARVCEARTAGGSGRWRSCSPRRRWSSSALRDGQGRAASGRRRSISGGGRRGVRRGWSRPRAATPASSRSPGGCCPGRRSSRT